MKVNVYKIIARVLCVVLIVLMIAGRVSNGTVEQATEDNISSVYAESFLNNSVEEFERRIESIISSSGAEFSKLSRVSTDDEMDDCANAVFLQLGVSSMTLYLEKEPVKTYGEPLSTVEPAEITELRGKGGDFVSKPFSFDGKDMIAVRFILRDCGRADEAIIYYTTDRFVQVFFSAEAEGYDYSSNNQYFCLSTIDGFVLYGVSDGILNVGNNVYDFINNKIESDATKITAKMMGERFVTGEKVPFVFSLGGTIYVSSFAYTEYLGGNYVLVTFTDYNDLSFGKDTWDTVFNVFAVIFFLLSAVMLVRIAINEIKRLKNKEIVDDEDEGEIRSFDRFKADSERSVREGRERYAIVCIGVEKFHLVRELHGEEISKEAIRFLNSVIRKMLFDDEAYGHLENENFVVMLRYKKHDEMVTRLKMLSDITERYKPFFIERSTLKLRIGVYPIEDLYDADEAVRNARMAQTIHDDNPRVICVFHNEAVGVLDNGISLDPDRKLKDAINSREFRIFYEPVCNVSTRKLDRANIVVKRYDNVKKTYISEDEWPDEFRTPEFKGMLDFHIYREALRYMHSLSEDGIMYPPISFEISDKAIEKEKFPIPYTDLRKRLSVPSGAITLRFSEEVALGDPAKFRLISEKLNMGGINAGIEDISQAVIARNILKKAPVQEISLGKKFISPSFITGPDFALLKTSMDAVKSYGIRTVQMDVENEEEFVRSHDAGRDAVCGKYYSEPLTPYEFKQFLKGSTELNASKNEEGESLADAEA